MTAPRLLHSQLLAHVPHAFTTRVGGISSGVFASLNFGNPGDLPTPQRDPASNIAANFASTLTAINCAGREVVEVYQIHGPVVHTVRSGQPAHPAPHDTRADAIVTDDPSRVLVIGTADCAPVLLASADGRIVAAVHAGWRGVLAGIIPNTVAEMRELGADDIAAAIGPCIGPDAFEVGPEVAADFRRVFGDGTPSIRLSPAHKNKFHADIPGAICQQLTQAAIARTDDLKLCTVANGDLFYSHRRDNRITGRMAALIACAG
ncbi:MAG: peptidoglycan editing factor PgeF [Phycisphaerales bacterium]